MSHSSHLDHPDGRVRRLLRPLLAGLVGLAVAACADAPSPVAPAGRLSLGKAPAGPSVNAASPAYAHRDTTLDVHVLGSGFTDGAVAEWALAGVPNAAKIRTNSTRFVSSSELIANITVAADADLAFWDITVTLIGGKKGVGTEKFEVTTATVIGTGIGGYVMGTSDQVSVAGYGDLSGAWVYDNISGAVVDLGPGQAWGIDPTGTVALGRDGNWAAVAWVRGPTGVWTKQLLPGPEARGNATSAAVAPDGSLIVGGWIQTPVRRNDYVNRPAVWRRVGGVWTSAQVYSFPGQAASIYDITPTGVAVGRTTATDGTVRAVVWDNPTSYTVLDGLALFAVNAAGTIIVGDGVGPSYWYRTASGGWSAAVLLPRLGSSCSGGRPQDVNDAGIIVGRSCISSSKYEGTVWKLDLSGAVPTLAGPPSRLGGLGVAGSGADNTVAVAVTSTAPYVIVGYVATGNNVTVQWPAP